MAQRSSSRKPRNSGATRRSGGKKGNGGAPVWVWLVTGLLAGLFIAFLIVLGRVDTPPEKRTQQQQQQARTESAPSKESKKGKETSAPRESQKPSAATSVKETNKAPATVAKAAPAEKPASSTQAGSTAEKPVLNYDFYKILPKSEVVVPEEDLRKPAGNEASAPGTYYLQVGAFRRIEEADGRKAELAMLGIVSSIQTVTLEPNNSWHRVRIGPVKDMRQLDRTKRQLQDNNISFVTIKENR